MATALVVVLPLGFAALIAFGLAQGLGPRRSGWLRVGPLAATQCGAFLAQEILERALSGHSIADIATERGVWYGLIAQLFVAWMLVRLTRAMGQVVDRIRGSERPRRVSAVADLPACELFTRPSGLSLAFSIVRRGPPLTPTC
jgi:hypothetical protein